MTPRNFSIFLGLGSLALGLVLPARAADDEARQVAALSDKYYKSGTKMLSVFKPVAASTRDSVAVLRASGMRIALATVVDSAGYLVTKASELKPGRVTAVFSSGAEYEAVVLATDIDSDLALLRVPVRGLRPVQWDSEAIAIGEWLATPGIDPTPEAVGIVSVNTRTIPRERAFMGVRLRTTPGPATIEDVTPGFGAHNAGLQKGDVIVKIGEEPIANYDVLTAKMKEFRTGDVIPVVLERDSETVAVSVKLTAESVVLSAEAQRASNGGRAAVARSDRMNRMGTAVSERAKDFPAAIQHDTVLEPWQCGGPLVSLSGKAVGINIARAGRVASYALPASLVSNVVRRLIAQATPTRVTQN